MPDAATRYRLISSVSGLLLAVFLTYLGTSLFVSLLLTQLIGLEISEATDLTATLKALPEGRFWLLGMQAVVHGASFLIVPLIFWRREHRRPDAVTVHQPQTTSWQTFLLVVLAGIALLPLIQALTVWNQSWEIPGDFGTWARRMEDQTEALILYLTSFDSTTQFLLGLLVMAVLPGVGEELLFRGLLQNQFRTLFGRPHLAVLLTALLFSAIHLQFYGFATRALLGIWFGYLYLWTRNLWVPVLAHFVHNGVTLLLVYLARLSLADVSIESPEYPPLPLLLGSLAVSGLLIFRIWQQHRSTHTNTQHGTFSE